jgi:NAD(P)-dependent dehydrogenase (short-subunit alcohol dehydrogenase family)
MSKAFKKFDLTDRLALITGAAGLMGKEHAAALLESGATVVLTDIDATCLASTKKNLLDFADSNRILTQVMDVTKTASIRNTAERLAIDERPVDILINNAAIDPKVTNSEVAIENSRLETFNLDQWNIELSVGLTGAFLCSQFFGSLMAKNKRGGVILNIASDLSVIAPDQRLYRRNGLDESAQAVKPVTYSVIKAGLIGLTRYLATYWADCGVRANALSPGGVFNDQGEDFVKRITSLIPLGRMANHDEYRSIIQFLCSDASSYLNGQNIVMDGGRSIW